MLKFEANGSPSSRSALSNVIIGCTSSRPYKETQHGEETPDYR